MSKINFYYLEKPTLSNLNRIFESADIPFIRLSKFLSQENSNMETKLSRDEKIGFYKRNIGKAHLGNFWKSKEFLSFLKKCTGLNLKFRSSEGQSYQPGDYSLLHSEEFEKKRLVVVYDFTKQSEIKYNDNYSQVNDLRTAFPLPLRETKQTDFPTRTHRSAKADPTSLIDNWRLFLANEYRDLPKNRGDLWKLASFNNLLYFHMEDSLYAAKGKQSMQMKDGSEAFVGSGDIFQQDPDEIIHTKTGHGGTQSQFASLTTRNGYFFVDRKAGKVFLMGEKLSEISNVGMESWFRKNLKYEMENWGMTSTGCIADNPLQGFGLHSAWDPKYKRIILTKREKVPTKNFRDQWTLQITTGVPAGSPGVLRWNESECKYQVYIPVLGSGSQWDTLEWDNDYYFKQSGWTISYFPELNIWVSLHSYVPYIYFSTSRNFFSLTDKWIDYLNGNIDTTGVWNFKNDLKTTTGIGTIWRHNEKYKGVYYQDYKIYVAPFMRDPFELEYIDNSSKGLDKVYYNISYTLQTFKYNNDTDTHDLNILNHGFTSFYVYNTHQLFSGDLEYLVHIRRVGNEWKINKFRDLAALAVQNTAGGYYMSTNTNVIGGINTGTLTTLHGEKMFTINNLDPYYSETINNSYIDTAKLWNERRKFTDKWIGIRLIYNNIENNLLNLYSTEVGARKYKR